jgi:hypothetical protein
MVVICPSCGKHHNIPFRLFEDRFRGRMVVIGCKQCGADIRVDGTERTSNPPPRPPSTAPKPRLTPVTKYVGVTSKTSGGKPSARVAETAPTARRSIQPPDELDWSAPGAAVDQPAAAGSETPWVLLLPDASNRELTLPDLLKALRSGEVSAGNLVWRAGMAQWQPISQVPDLTPYLDSLQEDEPTRSERSPKRGER